MVIQGGELTKLLTVKGQTICIEQLLLCSYSKDLSNKTCLATTSPLITPLRCPLEIIVIASYPLKICLAGLNQLKPIPGLLKRLINQVVEILVLSKLCSVC